MSRNTSDGLPPHEPLRVLLLEDSQDDADLVVRELGRGGFEVTSVRTDSEITFRRELQSFGPEIILADYAMPGFDGERALELARQESPQTPFLFVSASMGEEIAVETLRRGATDYVVKNRLGRLVPAVRRAVGEANERRVRVDIETRLWRRLAYEEATARCVRLLAVSSLTDDVIDEILTSLLDTAGVSRAYLFRHREVRDGDETDRWMEITHQKTAEGVESNLDDAALQKLRYDDAAPTLVPTLLARKTYEAIATDLPNPERAILDSQNIKSILILPVFTGDHLWGFVGFDDCRHPRRWHDEDKRMLSVVADTLGVVAERQQSIDKLTVRSAALEAAADAIVITDKRGTIEWVNEAWTEMTWFTAEESVGQTPSLVKSGMHDEALYAELWRTILAGRVWKSEFINRRKDGFLYDEHGTITPVRDHTGTITHFVAIKQDITDRKLAAKQLQQHAEEMEFRSSVGTALARGGDFERALRHCADAIVHFLDVSLVQVWIAKNDEGLLELRADSGGDFVSEEGFRRAPLGTRVPSDRGMFGQVVALRQPLAAGPYDDATVHSSHALDDDAASRLDRGNPLRFRILGFPLTVDDRCVGVIAIHGESGPDSDRLKSLRSVADVIAQNVDRVFKQESLDRLNADLEQRIRQRTALLAESERFNRATLDALSSHVAVVAPDGTILATNRAWKDFAAENGADWRRVSEGSNYLSTGCTSSPASSKSKNNNVEGVDNQPETPDSETNPIMTSLRRVLRGEIAEASHEYPCHSPDRQRWFQCRINRFMLDAKIHALVAHENITELKLTEEALRESKGVAEAASLAKSEFLTTMSHELRTPLNGILGMTDLLEATELTERQKEFVRASKGSGQLLLQLINDILDLSKIEAGKLELDRQPCRLDTLLGDTVYLFQGSANDRGIELAVELAGDLGIQVKADPHRLRQVLVNLIGNAIKFTSEGCVTVRGSRIDTRAERDSDSPTETGRFRFSVQDTGIGIPESRRDRLFRPFSQVDSSITRQFGGTGLGLSICRRLVELMGGTIGVESQPGVGTEFWFEIPAPIVTDSLEEAAEVAVAEDTAMANRVVSAEPASISEAGSPPPPVAAGLRGGEATAPLRGHLLVAEDNQVNQLYIVELIKLFGCTCDLVVNGDQALAAFTGNPTYSMILMDCQMPEMDGFTATGEIRKWEERSGSGRHVPIVALTANALKGDRERCLHAGMDDYVSKPINPETLRQVIASHLQDAD